MCPHQPLDERWIALADGAEDLPVLLLGLGHEGLVAREQREIAAGGRAGPRGPPLHDGRWGGRADTPPVLSRVRPPDARAPRAARAVRPPPGGVRGGRRGARAPSGRGFRLLPPHL